MAHGATMQLLGSGGYAEYVTVDERLLIRIPAGALLVSRPPLAPVRGHFTGRVACARVGSFHFCCLSSAEVCAGMSFAQAAAVPETWLTAYQLLYLLAGVKAGDRVLVHAAGSGVGIAAIQVGGRRTHTC
jgi:NADPH:quinone reductase-like Zn-dependent oxidoreductase